MAITEEKRIEIVGALEVNPHATAVARQLGLGITTVWKIAKKAGIELTAGTAAKGNRAPRLSPEKRAEIVTALTENPNANAVARQLGISHGTVSKTAETAGLELPDNRGRNRQSPERRAEIIRAFEANPNARAVARQIGGISFAGVLNIVKKAGLEIATRGRPQRKTADQDVVSRRRRAKDHDVA